MPKFQSLSALCLSNKLFNYLSPMIITWSQPHEQFEIIQGQKYSDNWKWCFNTFVVAGVIGFGSCLDVITHRAEVGSSMFVIACGFASLSFLYWSTAAVVIRNVDEVVNGIKYLKNVFNCLERLPNQRIRTTTTTWHMTSNAIQLAVLGLAIIPLTMIPLCLWVGLDPFFYTFPKIIPIHHLCANSTCNSNCIFLVNVVIILFRVICGTICVTEACRFFAVLFCMLIYIVELVVGCIQFLSHANCVSENLSFFEGYTALRIAHKVIYSPICTLFALIMGDGFIIILSTNLATIRAYHLLPVEVYWFMPTVSMIFSFFIFFSLPFAVKVCESSKRMLYARKMALIKHGKLVTPAKRKQMKREILATRPIGFSCGEFYDLERGAESTYFYFIFLKTVDGLLI